MSPDALLLAGGLDDTSLVGFDPEETADGAGGGLLRKPPLPDKVWLFILDDIESSLTFLVS